MFERLVLQDRQTRRPRNSARLAGFLFLDAFANPAKPESDDLARPRLDRKRVMRGGLCPSVFRIDRVLATMNDAIVDSVFDVPVTVWRGEEKLGIRFVFSEKQIVRVFAVELVIAERAVACLDRRATARQIGARAKDRPAVVAAPGPCVPKPKR